MKAASIQEIKNELKEISHSKLVDICLRLGKYKKENKELLTYLLFEANDVETYIQQVKDEIDEGFENISTNALYLIKKSLRKILRIANKHIRFIGEKTAEVEILLHFCESLNHSGIPFQRNTVLSNLYKTQIKKVSITIESLHEDLQYEYIRKLRQIENNK